MRTADICYHRYNWQKRLFFAKQIKVERELNWARVGNGKRKMKVFVCNFGSHSHVSNFHTFVMKLPNTLFKIDHPKC